MFVQVIKGQTNDAAGLRRQLDRWLTDLRPGAIGYLGGTYGITDDGTFILFGRFDDESSARKNGERSEQGAWWAETEKYFDSAPTFRESSDIATMFGGGSDKAGFVQVMEGRVADRSKVEGFESDMLDQLRAARPDLLGSLRVWLDGGNYVEAAYFTSEAEAREGESSAEFAGPSEEYAGLFGEMTFLDLRDPQFSS